MQIKTTALQNSQTFSHCKLGIMGTAFGDVGVLVGLGLSVRQARVYLALFRVGVAKVQVVSDLSGVPRQEVYRVLDGLQQLGLVERKVSNPASFSVAPIGDAVKLLLNQRTVELNVMAKKAERLTNRLCKNSVSSKVDLTLRPCFGTIVEADRGRHYRQAIKNTHKTIEATTSWRRFKQLSIHFDTQLLSALRRGAAVHVATEHPSNQPLPNGLKPQSQSTPILNCVPCLTCQLHQSPFLTTTKPR